MQRCLVPCRALCAGKRMTSPVDALSYHGVYGEYHNNTGNRNTSSAIEDCGMR